MSRLLVNTLDTGGELFQTVVPTQNISLRVVYLGLYVSRAPGGNVSLEIQDSVGKTIESSDAVTVASLSTEDFAHGLFRFDIDTPLKESVVYRMALVPGGGYTSDSNNFVGWKRDFDHTVSALRRVPATYAGARGYNSPFDYLIVERENVRKGRT